MAKLSRRRGLGKGKGKGYKNILRTDPLVHSRAAKGQKTFIGTIEKRLKLIEKQEIKPLEKRVNTHEKFEVIEPPEHKLAKNKEQRRLQKKILKLLYNVKEYDGEPATEHEVLTIVAPNLPSPKLKGKTPADMLEFLRDYTDWKAIGESKKWGREQNIVFQIEFLDTKNNKIGQELIRLFDEYNRKYIKEDVLYVRTTKLSESSLPLRQWR